MLSENVTAEQCLIASELTLLCRSVSPYIVLTDNKTDSLKIVEDIVINHYPPEKILAKYFVIDKNDKKEYTYALTLLTGWLTKKYCMNKNFILNNETFSLSKLDMEMVKSIPPGGNWTNIPQNVINKSQRLKTIQKTGGRTTLYGRLDNSKPSYTITTYFNRPGNGAYIHPTFDRVLTVREAARLQSFPDDFFFVGNKTDKLKQIGNAVPTILAYELGKKLVEHEFVTSLDLFSGAGGLTYGFSQAGIETLMAVDFFKAACQTLQVNMPKIPVLFGDLTDIRIKQKIFSTIKTVDIVCGGPPCQGFSHAGKRFVDDPRNQLFKEYVEIVDKLSPKVFILENVSGMLTLDKGSIYKEIVETFQKLGYVVEGRLLYASDYGVPQKRKRLILIGVREDIKISVDDLFPPKTSEIPYTVGEALADIELNTYSLETVYPECDNMNNYNKLMKQNISYDTFHQMTLGTQTL